jgi:phosphoribosyl-ATP pyrophosphohydrolase/phosphoribosyl-AMP cyclohydrolase
LSNLTAILDIKFNADGLVPAIVQEQSTKEVLMLAYMNQEALEQTLATGKTWFWSRSRQKLWNKGETSGHFQQVLGLSYDCDADTLLVQVDQLGVACHTGAKSCFFNEIPLNQMSGQAAENNNLIGPKVLQEVFEVIKQRQAERPEGSYTTYLFDKGIDKILKKVGEEAAEVIIASKNDNGEEIAYETADLLYHLMVALAHHNLTWEDIYRELAKRR